MASLAHHVETRALFQQSSNATTLKPVFGRVTPWSVQLAYVFAVYASVALVCLIVFLVSRYRKVRRLQQQLGMSASDVEAEALLPADPESVELRGDVEVADTRPHGELSTWRFLWHLATMSNAELQRRCGADAAFYLRFQMYVLACLSVMTVVGLAVLVPVYVYSDGIVSTVAQDNFELLTATNLPPSDPKLWAVMASLVLNSALMYGIVLHIFRSQMRELERDPTVTIADFSVQIQHFPIAFHDEQALKRLMETEGAVWEVAIGLDLARLHAFDGRVKRVLRALAHAKAWNNLHPDKRAVVNRRYLGLCGPGEDAVIFYKEQKAALRREMASLRRENHSGNGTAFVTFHSLEVARRVAKSFSGVDPAMQTHLWSVRAAPHPTDLIHSNLHVGAVERFLRLLAINVVLVAVMVFFTTPASLFAILSGTDSNLLDTISASLVSVFGFFGDANTIYGFLSSTLMAVFTTVIPRVLIATARGERHHTKSHLEMSIVRKIFAFLFLTIVLMPAIFMTSMDVLIKQAISRDGGLEILRDLGGVFPRAIFFVNYLMAVGLVSNFFELLNFPASLVNWYRRGRAITPYERARAAELSPFQVGYEYAYLNVVLAMTLLFSTVVPVLVPFGLVTFFTKHMVDRNNLVYAYTSTHSNARMLRIVLTQVVIGTAFYQLAMFSFFLFSKQDEAKAILSGLLLVPSVAIGIYVRFWSSLPRAAAAVAFDEDGIQLAKALQTEAAYRDPVLTHAVVKRFYSKILQ